MAIPKKQDPSDQFKDYLENPDFLRIYIQKTEEVLRREKDQLATEQNAHAREMEKLPLFARPMNAPYWMRRKKKLSTRARCLEAAKAKLQELEK
jgi:O-glycosyl hydrolase